MNSLLVLGANSIIRWPARQLCEKLRKGDGRSCICRHYDVLVSAGAGYYVVESDGHAYALFRDKPDALRYVTGRKNEGGAAEPLDPRPRDVAPDPGAPSIPSPVVGIVKSGELSRIAPADQILEPPDPDEDEEDDEDLLPGAENGSVA